VESTPKHADPALLRASALALAVVAMTLTTLASVSACFAAGGAPEAGPVQSAFLAQLPPELQSVEARSPYGMVVSGMPEASRVGAAILARGGNAVDAAVATAFAVGVLDPFNAGLGGQCYILVHLHDGRDVAVDGSAPFPLRVAPDELRPLKESGFVHGYKFATTPSTPAALAHALRRFGTMTLAQVLAPAIELAENGHVLTPTLLALVDEYGAKIREDCLLTRLFFNESDEHYPLDHVYRQAALGHTLRRIATGGIDEFYRGRIADEIAADMTANGGYVSKADLAHLRITERIPVHGRYRGLDVVAFPNPGGGEIVVEALQILDSLPAELLSEDSVDRLHVVMEANRLAFHDASAAVPSLHAAFRDATRIQRRAELIRFDRTLRDDELPATSSQPFGDRDTTQVSVVDRFGNAVSLTQSLGYGAFVVTPTLGFQYNSLLETCDFCDPTSPSFPVPFGTLRSTMAPTIVLCKGAPLLVLGTPGSSRIPGTIVTVISNVVDRGMSLVAAIAAPRALRNFPNPRVDRVGCRSITENPIWDQKAYLEIAGEITAARADELEARGFTQQYRLAFPPPDLVQVRSFGAVNAVMVDPATGLLIGVGDARRQGGAAAPERP
jgi:gamma-glutamyltranspeptidase/glutathione hydrolase